jgi:hypothetical protein
LNPSLNFAANSRDCLDPRVAMPGAAGAATLARTETLMLGCFGQWEKHYVFAPGLS